MSTHFVEVVVVMKVDSGADASCDFTMDLVNSIVRGVAQEDIKSFRGLSREEYDNVRKHMLFDEQGGL